MRSTGPPPPTMPISSCLWRWRRRARISVPENPTPPGADAPAGCPSRRGGDRIRYPRRSGRTSGPRRRSYRQQDCRRLGAGNLADHPKSHCQIGTASLAAMSSTCRTHAPNRCFWLRSAPTLTPTAFPLRAAGSSFVSRSSRVSGWWIARATPHGYRRAVHPARQPQCADP